MYFNRLSMGVLRAPAGEPGAGAGDPPKDPNPGVDLDAFAAKLLGEFDKRVNAIDKKINVITKQLEPKEPPPAGDPPAGDPPVAEPPQAKTVAELNSQIAGMRKQLENLTTENVSEKKRREVAEKAAGEEKRVNAFDSAIADVPFVSPKARQQFRDAYLQKVVTDDDGNFVVNTDKGPMAYADFLKSEAESSTHLLAPQGSGGSGASAGTKPRGGSKIDIANMSVAEVAALPKATQDALLKEYSS